MLALVVGLAPQAGIWIEEGNRSLNSMAAVAALMAVWWLTDAIPMAATGLVPLVLFPLMKLMPAREVARFYGSSMLFLFLGGFFVALAVERSGLHRRVALAIAGALGDSPRRLVLGFMLATAVLSMWMSNTATTVMLLPIAAYVLSRLEEDGPPSGTSRNFGVSLLLGIAYSASIGGFATLIGTPTNVFFRQFYEDEFVTGPELTFGNWMLLATPLSLLFLVIAWAVLVFVVYPVSREAFLGGREVIQAEQKMLGPLHPAERRMAIIFAITALLWLSREPVPDWGWAPALGLGRDTAANIVYAEDATVAMMMALVCFALPSEGWRGKRLLDWDTASRAPWGILLLFGGGLALAQGMKTTGLDVFLGRWLAERLAGTPRIAMVGGTSLGMTFFTELTGNLSCISMSMPILKTLAQEVKTDPRLLMIPAAISATCAFMLPVATPPNAIVYSAGVVQIRDMVKAGFILNLLGVVLIVTFIFTVGVPLLGIDTTGLPEWAAETVPATR